MMSGSRPTDSKSDFVQSLAQITIDSKVAALAVPKIRLLTSILQLDRIRFLALLQGLRSPKDTTLKFITIQCDAIKFTHVVNYN